MQSFSLSLYITSKIMFTKIFHLDEYLMGGREGGERNHQVFKCYQESGHTSADLYRVGIINTPRTPPNSSPGGHGTHGVRDSVHQVSRVVHSVHSLKVTRRTS